MDYYTANVLDTMALVDALVQQVPTVADDATSIPLVGGIQLYVGSMGYYPEPIAPYFCAPFCETLQ